MRKCPRCNKEYDNTWFVCLHDNAKLIDEQNKDGGVAQIDQKPKIFQDNIIFAGFWIRALAFILDMSVIIVTDIFTDVFFRLPTFIPVITWIVVFAIMTSKNGTTIGKQICKIRTISKDLRYLDFGEAILREDILKGISGLILGIGYFMVIWDKKKQSLHDKMIGSYVVWANSLKQRGG